MPCYTIEQTATHCTPEDCWIAVRGSVYDVTAFLKEHPGGGGVISSLAGKDATEEFESIGHSLKAELLMEGLKIGQLASVPSPALGSELPPRSEGGGEAPLGMEGGEAPPQATTGPPQATEQAPAKESAGGEPAAAKAAKPGSRQAFREARGKSREWKQEGRNDEDAKFKKRKYAIIFGYTGTQYCGLQLQVGEEQQGVVTVEMKLIDALIEAQYLPKMQYEEAVKYSLQRASRTDKGVHAVRNLINIKMRETEKSSDEIAAEINKHLPSDIIVYGAKRVTNTFDAKLQASSRIYYYTCPTYMFVHPFREWFDHPRFKEWEEEGITVGIYGAQGAGAAVAVPKAEEGEGECRGEKRKREEMEGAAGVDENQENQDFVFDEIPQDVLLNARKFRIGQPALVKIRELLKLFEGTHSFHNFTKGMKPHQKGTDRFITGMDCSEPFLHPPQPEGEGSQVEMLRIGVQGQSFLFHQIRKMVGMVMLSLACNLPNDLITKFLSTNCVQNIPPAPGMGLALEEVLFEKYHKKLEHLDRGEEGKLEWKGRWRRDWSTR